MRVLICGGRNYENEIVLFAKMDELDARYHFTLVIVGGQRGADTLGEKWANTRKIAVKRYEVTKEEWNRIGRRAGPLRNQKMLDESKPQMVVAFPTPESSGTWDMVGRAKRAGIEVLVFK